MTVRTIEKAVKTELGDIIIRRAESVTIRFLDGTLAVLTRLENDDGEKTPQTFFSGGLTDEPTDAGDFLSNITHDLEDKNAPEMWEASPKEWTILRESMRVLIGDETFAEESEKAKTMCASCGSCRPNFDGADV